MERVCALQRGVWVFEGCGDPKWGRTILFYIRISKDFAIFAHGPDRFHKANWFQMHSFSWSFMDPSNFRIKIHKISALGAKCYRYVTKSDPGVKITLF